MPASADDDVVVHRDPERPAVPMIARVTGSRPRLADLLGAGGTARVMLPCYTSAKNERTPVQRL
jgi:hypothetical protein